MQTIKRFDALQARERLPALLDLLADSVNNGASIGFLRPLNMALGNHYWQDVFAAVEKRAKVLLVTFDGDALVGSAQLDLCTKQNGTHRAEVQKVLVLSKYRRKGIATALMRALEGEATSAGRSLLFLDTEQHSEGEPFYESQAWRRVGSIPDYAMSADGVRTPNIIYYKQL